MPEVVYLLVKLGFLALLWVFVLLAVVAIRRDLVGPSIPRRVRETPAPKAKPAPRKAAAAKKGTPTTLVVVDGGLVGTRISLAAGPITIGRADDCTLVLTDDYVSNRHARFYQRPDDTWVVEDLGSTNGTYLDRERIHGPTPVPVGTQVRVGKTAMELQP